MILQHMKNYIYYIGANSSLQKQIIWDSVEDVIKLSKSNYEKKTQNELVKIADDFSKGKIDEDSTSISPK